MAGLGTSEILIILLVIIILFGVGRISKVSKELGRGIRLFREAIKGENSSDDSESPKTNKFDNLDDY